MRNKGIKAWLGCVAGLAAIAAAQPWDADMAGGPERAVDLGALRAALESAPAEGEAAPARVEVPLPGGGWMRLRAWASPIMEPGLAARFPEVRTYAVRGEGPGEVGRLDVSAAGLHALVLRPGAAGGGVYVSAVPGRPDRVRVREAGDAGADFDCTVLGDGEGPVYGGRGPTPLRTYRMALACTGEYAQFYSARQGHAPNVADAMAAMVTMVNRLNVVTETDAAVRMVLVANNDALVFLDPATDPYSATDSGQCLSANPSAINSRIGSANYDVGHVVTRIPGGVAYLRGPCGGNKAGGVSGLPRTDTGDPLDAQVLMHEVGHQLGANHSFNGNVDRCLSNRNGSTAWEPGSGTTLQSYAGGCPVGNVPPGDNISITRDLMYHSGNLDEIRAFLAAGGSNCGTSTPTGNTAPTITSMPPVSGLVLPVGTPFALTAGAADAEGDGVTYSWEELDLGPQQSLTGPDSADNGLSPLFRTFAPVASGTRVFPRWADVLSGAATPGERMATVSGATRRFRVAVRDNHAGGGAVTISPVVETTIAPAGPFEVTWPGAGEVVAPGARTVAWSVAGTDAPPVGVSAVEVWLSTDGGATFAWALSGGPTPNDGAEAVEFPVVEAGAARVMVRAVGSVFFAVSASFALVSCDGDYNVDGNRDQDDVAYLIGVVAGASNPSGRDPDFNRDGSADQDDITALVNVIAGGACP